MYLVYTRYIPDIYFGVYVGIYQVYTRYIPGLEITRYIPGIYLVYTSYIADVGLYPVYTRYIPGKFHFYRFQMLGATCFGTGWRARANFRRLLLRDSPSSQPPRLPKFNFGTALPTRCTNYSVLPNAASGSTFVHWVLNAILS
jgi:hypothetical protein